VALTIAVAFSRLRISNSSQVSAWSAAVVIYEIRTLDGHGATSPVMVAEYPNDVVAIVEAREFLRHGETIEVWREGTLIYRTSARVKLV
jgi:hypothetical protein